ncbi:peptidase family M49-domain-containing protein [Dichotomopilus funicola]|uniref:Peptidase family M49-domain-containing protein n=1 Tax=Dichotomopilus funicola TaxID=1934379 RepID=A0AAN6ZKT1_9PEZI|nr:peptidase family M49-domain-containing protein [Dichotomopilus funicola]
MATGNPKPIIHQLAIKPLFDGLTAREKLYAHHLSKAAWNDGKILMRQVSEEGPAIANVILSLYRACQGQWKQLANQTGVSAQELDGFLDYSAQFFCLGGRLANTIEECRANLAAYFLADNRELLELFGYNKSSTPTADDFIYYTYLFIAVEGVLGLQFYEKDGQSWGQPHRRAAFAILKHLLLDAADLITIHRNLAEKTLRIHINRAKILSHGKPSLGRLLTKIHIWRCTADIPSREALYEPLSTVDGIYEEWRQIVVAHPEPQGMFVQANTLLDRNGRVEVKVYEESREGIIQSFAERWG